MTSEFSFKDIGQGGFYTGHLFPNQFHGPKFSFVYDCGTLSKRAKIKSRITSFKGSLSESKLDMLFISHIDDDHVNGLPELLNGITCDRIYLPYLTPIERLYVAVRHNPSDTANLDVYLNFLKSPHDYLLSIEDSDIKEIIYIKSNSEQTFEPPASSEEPGTPEDSDPELNDNLEREDNDSSEDFRNEVSFKKGNGTLEYSSLWEFYLFHEPANDPVVGSFVEKIIELFQVDITDGLSKDQLVSILNNKDQLKKLRELYREKFKNLNKAGLIVQHKPLSYKSAQMFKYHSPWSIRHHFNCEYSCNRRRIFSSGPNSNNDWGVTLLTGDIGLNQIENSDYIKSHLDKVLVFQVPHHGSQTDWGEGAKLKLLNNKGKTTSVICFGFGNSHGHPKPQVLENLEYENFDIKFCNQYEGFSYSLRTKY